MKKIIQTMWLGIQKPFKKTRYIFILLAVFAIMLTLFTLIPVWTVSENTLTTQLGIFGFQDYVVLILLSSLSSLFLTLQVYLMKEKKNLGRASTAVGGGIGALFAGTAFCASCLAPLFAIFGIGFSGVVFVLEYRLFFVTAISIFMLIAIYLTARKIGRSCSSC